MKYEHSSFTHNVASEELIFEYFSQILSFSCYNNQSIWEDRTKIICLVEDHSNISVKRWSKDLQWDNNKALFLLFPV